MRITVYRMRRYDTRTAILRAHAGAAFVYSRASVECIATTAEYSARTQRHTRMCAHVHATHVLITACMCTYSHVNGVNSRVLLLYSSLLAADVRCACACARTVRDARERPRQGNVCILIMYDITLTGTTRALRQCMHASVTHQCRSEHGCD